MTIRPSISKTLVYFSYYYKKNYSVIFQTHENVERSPCVQIIIVLPTLIKEKINIVYLKVFAPTIFSIFCLWRSVGHIHTRGKCRPFIKKLNALLTLGEICGLCLYVVLLQEQHLLKLFFTVFLKITLFQLKENSIVIHFS